MKKIIAGTLLAATLFSCRNSNPIADQHLIDSLIASPNLPQAVKMNAADADFWKKRIDPASPGFTNEVKYAAALMGRFHLTGNICDIKSADSLLLLVDSVYAHKEAAVKISLARHFIAEHKFQEAKNVFADAVSLGIKPYDYFSTSFDIDFELGDYSSAKRSLDALKTSDDYAYYFRLAKYEHLNGNIDAAIAAMQKATGLAGENAALKQAAISNTADLYFHDGEIGKANELYMQSVRLSAADLHSLLAIGNIAMLHDNNIVLAKRIFTYAAAKTKSPEPLLRLIAVAEQEVDTASANMYAGKFIAQSSDMLYGNMYNKYLIDIYTCTVEDAASAEAIAFKELSNRATPQTYAWYAWTLFNNQKNDEAFKVYKEHVSGKPLETLELYWMGKMMLGLKKGYNAKALFQAAYKNRFDLSPAKMNDLEGLK